MFFYLILHLPKEKNSRRKKSFGRSVPQLYFPASFAKLCLKLSAAFYILQRRGKKGNLEAAVGKHLGNPGRVEARAEVWVPGEEQAACGQRPCRPVGACSALRRRRGSAVPRCGTRCKAARAVELPPWDRAALSAELRVQYYRVAWGTDGLTVRFSCVKLAAASAGSSGKREAAFLSESSGIRVLNGRGVEGDVRPLPSPPHACMQRASESDGFFLAGSLRRCASTSTTSTKTCAMATTSSRCWRCCRE